MKKMITILEDNRDIREICSYLLMEEGYNVQSFENIASLFSGHADTSLYLLDIQLPDGSGLEVCERLKEDEKYAHIPIIMMSAHLRYSKMAENSRANDFIEKPFEINFLLERIALLIP